MSTTSKSNPTSPEGGEPIQLDVQTNIDYEKFEDSEDALAEFSDVGSEDDRPCGWCFSPFCLCVRLTCLLAGILIPAIIFLLPCHGLFDEIHPDVNLMFMLDGSRSMSAESWSLSLLATEKFAKVFKRKLPDLRVGVIEYATRATLHLPLTGNWTEVEEQLPAIEKSNGATDYYRALLAWKENVESLQSEFTTVTYNMGVFLSDGKPTLHVPETVPYALDLKQNFNYSMMVVLVQDKDGEKVYNISSCYPAMHYPQKCPWYEQMETWEQLSDEVDFIAENVLTEIKPIDEVCKNPHWWWMLLLMLPFCCGIMFYFVCKKAEEIIDDEEEYNNLQEQLYQFDDLPEEDEIIIEIQEVYPGLVDDIGDIPEKDSPELETLTEESTDFYHKLRKRRNELDDAIIKEQQEIQDLEDEVNIRRRQLDDAIRVRQELFMKGQDVQNCFKNREVESELKSYLRKSPPPRLYHLIASAVMLCTPGNEEPTFEECYQFFRKKGFRNFDLNDCTPETVAKCKEVMAEHDINRGTCRYLCGELGLILYGFIISMMKYATDDKDAVEELQRELDSAKRMYEKMLPKRKRKLLELRRQRELISEAGDRMKYNAIACKQFRGDLEHFGFENERNVRKSRASWTGKRKSRRSRGRNFSVWLNPSHPKTDRQSRLLDNKH